MLHTCALDKLSDFPSWPQWQLVEKTSNQQQSHLCVVRSWSEGALVQHSAKAQLPLVVPCSHSLDRGENEGPALAPARHSLAQLCLLCSATSDLCWPQRSHCSPELWKLIRLHMLECEYMFPHAVRNFIQTSKPLRSQRNTLWPPAASLILLLPRINSHSQITWELSFFFCCQKFYK